MTRSNIYFDFNATTPVDPVVLEEVPQWLAMWGNPSSIHWHGRGPKKMLREARRSLADTLKCHPLEIVFTSGGSESNNLAIKGTLTELKVKKPERSTVVLGGIEHPSISKQEQQIEAMGFNVVKVPVNRDGLYDMDFFKTHVTEKVALVSVMLANNEIGVIAPLNAMIDWAHQQGAIFHSDMVQGLGKYPLDFAKYPVDLASFSSHKVYALKGAGLTYIKKGTPFVGLTAGGSQERGRRAGTENLPAIASFAKMVSEINVEDVMRRLTPLRDLFEKNILENISGVSVLGDQAERLCNTSCFKIQDANAESLLMNMDIRGFSVGTGAACSSGNPEPSPVLLSLGLKREEAQSSLRISLGKDTTQEQVMALAQNLKEVVEHLRQLDREETAHG